VGSFLNVRIQEYDPAENDEDEKSKIVNPHYSICKD